MGILKWPGGKSYLKNKIWELAPQHTFRGIACGGGLSEWWNWPHENVSEVINDINGDLVNLWRVWQSIDTFEDFQRRVEAVPFSRPHFLESKRFLEQENSLEQENNQPETVRWLDVDAVTRAVAYFVKIRQSMMGLGTSFTPISKARTRRGMNEQASAWLTSVDGLQAVHSRLKRVVIEKLDVVQFLRKYDCPNGLLYIDPPYYPTERAANLYESEMPPEKHAEMLDAALACKGSVMISGYSCPLYEEKLGCWNKVEVVLRNNMEKGGSKKERAEVLWMNY